MYVRVTHTVADRGVLVHPDEVEKQITDRKSDWYVSAFTYGEDALEYFNSNDCSIKGYNGEAWTSSLYWDLDYKGNFEKVRKSAQALIDKLADLGVLDSTTVFFSGNKGVHVYVHTKGKFTPEETSRICYNMAKDAGVSNDVLDTSVYNITRIFRIENTRHKESKLYKIPLDFDELESETEANIRRIAKKPRKCDFQPELADDAIFKELYPENYKRGADILDLFEHGDSDKPDFSECPDEKPRCIYALENGYIEKGRRHDAIIRLASYYKDRGLDRDQAADKIERALEKRHGIYEDVTDADPKENERDIDEIFSDKWEGGYFTCKTDHYLASKCDVGKGPCWDKIDRDKEIFISRAMDVNALVKDYVRYGLEADKEYPKTGITWLDDKIRLRPRNYSIINGANGSSKTSIAIQLLEEWNKQELHNMFFSLDMASPSLFEKLGARYTDHNIRDIEAAFNKNTQNLHIMKEVTEAITEKLPYTYFDFTSSASVSHIEKTLAHIQIENNVNIRAGIIDYAGRIASDFDSGYMRATQNATDMNDVAKRQNVHLIIISQIARENGDHTDPIRTSRVSKDSGAWEENATIILNVWRTFGDGLKDEDKFLNLYVAKNRSGSLGEMVFGWDGKTGTTFELDGKGHAEFRRLCEANDVRVPVFYKAREKIDQDPLDKEVEDTVRRVRNTKRKEEPKPRFKRSGDHEEELSDSDDDRRSRRRSRLRRDS